MSLFICRSNKLLYIHNPNSNVIMLEVKKVFLVLLTRKRSFWSILKHLTISFTRLNPIFNECGIYPNNGICTLKIHQVSSIIVHFLNPDFQITFMVSFIYTANFMSLLKLYCKKVLNFIANFMTLSSKEYTSYPNLPLN